MRLSLRARLTCWYSALLLLTLVLFSVGVLWLHWRLLVRQFDEELEAVTLTAINVLESELNERSDLALAATDTEEVVRLPDRVIRVLDSSGRPILRDHPFQFPPSLFAGQTGQEDKTIAAPDGDWRLHVQGGSAAGQRFVVVAAGQTAELREQWRTLLRALTIGVPLALLLAGAGGWWLGLHGLRPISEMASQAEDITARNTTARLTVPHPGDELGRLAASFNRVLDRLGSALENQRRFMADASHELRTPVSVIRTAADVTLSREGRSDLEYREALGAVAQQSSRLGHLVDDMFVLARADGGGYPMRVADVDLEEVVSACLHDARVLAAERGTTLRTAIEASANHVVRGDEGLLRQMLMNLLNNGIEHTPAGSTVTVSLTSRPAEAELRVTDTGAGIAPADVDRIFDRFVRLDPSRHAGGAGLGLSIARWIAETHGGTLRMVEQNGSGSTFAAVLPVTPPS